MKITLTLSESDDYRAGPEIYVVRDPAGEDESSNDFECEFSNLQPGHYSVHLVRSEWDTAECFGNYANLQDAVDYCKLQFKLYTGCDPFVQNGNFSGNYHPDGDREKIVVPTKGEDSDESMSCDFEKRYDDGTAYLIILMDQPRWHFEGHPLKYDAVW